MERRSKVNDPAKSEYMDLKERILLSAIEEFGRREYESASTNAIVQRAGVSKGLLFHYYGNKEKLFLACVDYIFSKIWMYIQERLCFPDGDIFHRIRLSLQVKMDFYRDNPMLMELASKLWDSDNRPGIEEYIRRLSGASQSALKPVAAGSLSDVGFHILGKDLDLRGLNDGVDPEKALDYIGLLLGACWTRFSDLYGNDAYRISDNIGEYLAEADEVLDMFRRGVYRGNE